MENGVFLGRKESERQAETEIGSSLVEDGPDLCGWRKIERGGVPRSLTSTKMVS